MQHSQNLTPPLSPAQMREAGPIVKAIVRQMPPSITRLEIVLGCDTVLVHDATGARHILRRRRTSRTMCEYFLQLLIDRGALPSQLVLGIEVEFEGRVALVRSATLEESARYMAAQLREPGGWALTRTTADRVANILDSLAYRTSQPVRQS